MTVSKITQTRGGASVGAADLVVSAANRAGVPTWVTFQVTDRCNYNCVHCFQPRKRDAELTTDEIDRALKDVADAGVLFLTLMGGEFFMRRDADEILRIARRRGFAIKVITTGHYINDARADLIAELGAIEVHLSVYSANHRVHDAVTLSPGSWDRTLRAAQRLLIRRVRVTLKTPAMSGNITDLDELTRFAEEIGASISVDPKVMGRLDSEMKPTLLRPSSQQLREFYSSDSIDPLRLKQPGLPMRETPLDEAPCHAGRSVAAINPQGDVWPCNVLPIKCGNVRDQSFSEIWQTAPVLRRVRNITWADISECNECALRSYCARCHSVAWLEDGKLAGPALECCRHAVIVRDTLRDRGLVPKTKTEFPPTWDRVVARESAPGASIRPPALKVLP